MEIMFISGQEGMGLMDKWRGGSRRDYKQFFHFNRRKKRNILAKMQVSGWKLEEVLSSVSIFSGKQNTKQTSEKWKSVVRITRLNSNIQMQMYLKSRITGNSYNIKVINHQRKNKHYFKG